MRWTVVIPVKALPAAKSRLAPASADPDAHRRLVEAIRADTMAAAAGAPSVARILLVTDAGQAGPDTVVQTRPGLNGALRDAAEHAARHWPGDGIAALVGDLPSLRSAELDDALGQAALAGGGFVADADGTGTTLLAAVPGRALEPRFGPGSASRHAEIVGALPAGAGLRRDVDTAEDLRRAAAGPGVGPRTHAVLHDTGDHPARRSPCLGMMPS